MKIIRKEVLALKNFLLFAASGVLLFACKENPLLLNNDVYSLDDSRMHPSVEVIDKTNSENGVSIETKNAKGITLFEAHPVQAFRKEKPDALALASNKETIKKETQKELKDSAQQLNTNGSIPFIREIDKTEQPQVVNETGIIQDADEIVQLDYEQIEIRQILEDLADALGMSIVIDPSISGKITMRTSPNQPLKNKDLWQVLNMLLQESGINLEKKAGLYYAKKSPLTLPAEVGYPSLLKDSKAPIALQITPLRYISVETALTVLKPLIGAKSKISQIAQLNMLAIVGSQEQLSRINGLLNLVDSDPFKSRGIRLYKIKQAEAKTIASELEEILKLIEGDKAAYKVLGLERINALLVVAPPKRGFKPVDRWVKILDEGADEGLQEQIFIYHCKSVKCETLAGTLNSIFETNSTQKNNVKKESSSNKSNVFRTVPKDSLNIKSKNKKDSKSKTAVKTQKTTTKSKNSADIKVTIVSDSDTNTLIVRTTGKDYHNLLGTIKLLDQTPLQVLVNVVIAQVSLSKSQSLGLDWKYQNGSSLVQNNLGKASSVVDGKPLGLIVSGTSGNFSASLNALAADGDINILSRPSLLIANNKEGAINIGKEVPVQTSSTTNLNATVVEDGGTGTQVTQEISYRNTGIELTVTPHINEDGVVNLEIKQSLSAIEGSTTSQDAAFKPTFTNQDIATTVVVGDGETIILGGLIDSVTTYKDSGIPFLKDIPIAGYLFKTQEESEDRRELMLIITPRIIGPETDLNLFGKEFTDRFKSVGKYMDKALDKNY